MDLGRVVEGVGERGALVPQRDAQPRDASTFRSFEGSRPASTTLPSNASVREPMRSSPDVWSGAIARLQAQVSLNTSMLESNRRQIGDIEHAVGRLQQEVGNVVAVIHEVRTEVHARSLQPVTHDSRDMDLLATQVATIGSKANEIDGLKMQLDLIRNRMRRLEEAGSPPAQRPGTSSFSSSHREPYEPTPAPAQHLHHQHARPQQLPSMRTAPAMSPPAERHHAMPVPPILPSQGPGAHAYPPEARQLPNEHPRAEPAVPSYRYAEPLPPPAALSGWRPAEPQAPQNAPQPPPGPTPFGSHAIKQEVSGSGWASVNQPAKRSFDEQHRSPYDLPASAPGSPKRPKLAPIMPRGGYGEEGFAHSQGTLLQQPASLVRVDSQAEAQARSRATSDVAQPHMLPTPSSANIGAYRFIPSAAQAQAEQQTSWRPEPERLPEPPPPQHSTAGSRGSRRGGRGRGGRGRGSRSGVQAAHESQETDTPEWERPGWSGSQLSPNSYYNTLHAGRGGVSGAPPEHPDGDFPATPAHGEHDPFGLQSDLVLNSSGKKSRTKPIRNAEGILIRKDGRPDMRSVSSANNLRKVHAKKEAERAEQQDGRTPTSGRSIAPFHSNSSAEDDHEVRSGSPGSNAAHGEDEGGNDTQDRHRELMSRIFPHGIDGSGERGLAGAYFPRREDYPHVMKTEGPEEMSHRSEQADTQMTDRPSDERPRDSSIGMEPIREEAGEERAAEHEQAQAQDQSAEQTATSTEP